MGNRNASLSPLVITSIFLDTIYEKSAFLIFPSISL